LWDLIFLKIGRFKGDLKDLQLLSRGQISIF
jgi:hypothetical protein